MSNIDRPEVGPKSIPVYKNPEPSPQAMEIYNQGIRAVDIMRDLYEIRVITGEPTNVMGDNIDRLLTATGQFEADFLTPVAHQFVLPLE